MLYLYCPVVKNILNPYKFRSSSNIIETAIQAKSMDGNSEISAHAISNLCFFYPLKAFE